MAASPTMSMSGTSSPAADDARPYKLVLIGDSAVGKSALLCRFADDSFPDSYISTIGVDFRFRTMKIGDQLVKLQIWDTAGQERFRTITAAYYRAADGIVLVYDVTNMESFRHVEEWLGEVELHAIPGVRKMIIGNKADLADERQVSEDMLKTFAESRSILWLETSAKTSTNVDTAFATLAEEVVKARLSPKDGSSSSSSRNPSPGGSQPCMCPAEQCRCDDKCGASGCRLTRRQHTRAGIKHAFQERCSCVIL